jgi:hypothetical protein
MSSVLLRSLVPETTARYPKTLLSAEQVGTAVASLTAAGQGNVIHAPLADGIALLSDENTFRQAKRCFEAAVSGYRGELYAGTIDSPAQRLQVHQALMAAGYYARAADMHATPIDATRFIANHYNFDVRRDKMLLHFVQKSIFNGETEAGAEVDAVPTALFQLERQLFGVNRLRKVDGKQWLLPGVLLSDTVLPEELDLVKLLEHPVVKANGNFALDHVEDQGHAKTVTDFEHRGRDILTHVHHDRWTTARVKCLPEGFAAMTQPLTKVHEHKTMFHLRVLLEAAPVSWIERMKQKALDVWGIWFAGWVLFWMVDEELITLIGLFWARYQQMKVLAEEAKRTGGKVYMAQGKFH